jgi:hypothetical protein
MRSVYGGSTIIAGDVFEEHEECGIVGVQDVLQVCGVAEVVVPKLVEEVLFDDLALLRGVRLTRRELSMLWKSFF